MKSSLALLLAVALFGILSPADGSTTLVTHQGSNDPTTEDALPLQDGTQSWTSSTAGTGAGGSAAGDAWRITAPANSGQRYINLFNAATHEALLQAPQWEFKIGFTIEAATSENSYSETIALFSYDTDPSAGTSAHSFQINIARGTGNMVRIGVTSGSTNTIMNFADSVGQRFTAAIRFDGTNHGFYINDIFQYNVTPGTTLVGTSGGISWGDQLSHTGLTTSTLYSEVTLSVIPEPGSIALMAGGCALLLAVRRRRRS